MSRYRKRPVVVEAVQWDGTEEHAKTIEIVRGALGLGIRTLEGFMLASPGDWIITGVKGERYPCKPDIFAATYEPVEEEKN